MDINFTRVITAFEKGKQKKFPPSEDNLIWLNEL